ncbi:alpha/beta hydrolase [Paenibacillus sp. strain BS8-2]
MAMKIRCEEAMGSGLESELPVERLLDGAEPETLIYKSIGDLDLRLLVMKPAGWRQEDQRPVILWIHGGGWSGGQPEQFVPHSRYTALRGAVGVCVQYRLIPRAESVPVANPSFAASKVEDCLSDCLDALTFLREHAAELGINPERIVVAGDSAGGHLAACLGTLPEGSPLHPFAVVNCNGIVDVTDKWRHSARGSLLGTELLDKEEAVRDWFQQREEMRLISPLQRARTGQPPSLTLHGLLDRTVEAEQSVRYVETHRSLGNDARLILYPRSKHAFILFGYTAAVEESLEALGDIDRFLADIGLWSR